MLLQEFEPKAIHAHYWNSFSPEKRGKSIISDYSEELQEDINFLMENKIDSETIEGYANRYKKFFSAYLSAKGRTANPMVTGPANFPVNRNQKALRSEDNHYKIWREWREKAKKSILRKSLPETTYISEIDRLKKDVESMKTNHEKMKAGNKEIAKAIKENRDISQLLIQDFGVAPHMVEWTMRWGFGLTNNLANIRNKEQRIKELERKELERNKAGEEQSANEYNIEGGKILLNFEEDRLQVLYDNKPEQDTITSLKKHGFKWSPKNTAWQRQLTNNALWTSERLFNIKLRRI